jgi:type I restriction enzyme M protein
MVDRTRQEFSDDDVARIVGTYHAWRGETDAGAYADITGFCKTAMLDEIRSRGHVLTPGLYVGAADMEEDDIPFEERFAALQGKLAQQFQETATLTEQIRAGLGMISYASK